jgi:hypothetical protein
MQEAEIIQIHTLSIKIRKELERQRQRTNGFFDEYDKMGVLPHPVHKSKDDHKRAVFILGKGINEMSKITG